MQTTEIAYICSPNYWRYLFLSLRTLLSSGSTIDRIVIYVVSETMPDWKFKDPRIEIKLVPDIGKGYWYLNKTHICNSDADRLIFLDTDTMILQPLDQVYEGQQADMLSRAEPGTYRKTWKQDKWEALFTYLGAKPSPYYTCGFMIFQNGAHRRMGDTWKTLAQRIIRGELPIKKTRFAEQQAFSLAIGVEGLTHASMEDRHHAYAMNGEPHANSVVYHLGTYDFYRYYIPIERDLKLHKKDLPVPRPRFLHLNRIMSRLEYRLKRRLRGHRDLAVENSY